MRRTKPHSPERTEEFGDILFTLVNYGRHLDVDTELALRRVNRKFRRRFAGMERLAREADIDFESLSLEEKDRLWNKVKEEIDDDD